MEYKYCIPEHGLKENMLKDFDFYWFKETPESEWTIIGIKDKVVYHFSKASAVDNTVFNQEIAENSSKLVKIEHPEKPTNNSLFSSIVGL
jgi:hypothetical protein